MHLSLWKVIKFQRTFIIPVSFIKRMKNIRTREKIVRKIIPMKNCIKWRLLNFFTVFFLVSSSSSSTFYNIIGLVERIDEMIFQSKYRIPSQSKTITTFTNRILKQDPMHALFIFFTNKPFIIPSITSSFASKSSYSLMGLAHVVSFLFSSSSSFGCL